MIGRYFSPPPPSTLYPPDVHAYNESFTALLQNIKKRHDPTVTSVATGVLEWKRKTKQGGPVGRDIQEWLDRFYMSRIGIRFLIGQREFPKSSNMIYSRKLIWLDVALNTLAPHPDYVGIICTRAVSYVF